MITHIFYKEWLKTKWFVLASLLIGVGSVLYLFIDLNSNIINSEGASNYIFHWFTGGVRPHYEFFQNIPFLIALLIGISQFIPEVLNKRIKLTLHLPAKESVLLYSMVFYGFLLIVGLDLLMLGLFFALDAYFFPVELHLMALNALIPWIFGGLATYFFVAMIAMEPLWKYRFLYAIIVYNLIDIFRLGGDMSKMYPLMIAIVVVASLGMIYTANRFKIGER